MKNLLLLLPVLFLLTSCEEEVESYDDLTADEQLAIQNMGRDQCLAKSEETFNKFKNDSAQVFTSAAYNRGQGFKFQLKNGTAEFKTINFSVWKQTANEIYFLVNDSILGGNYFLRITKLDNEAMINDLKAVYCARPQIYTSSATSSSLTMSYLNEFPEDTNTTQNDDRYLMYFNELAQFATYRVTRTKKVLDKDRNQVGNTETFTSSLSDQDKTFDYNTPNSYATKYCVLYQNGTYKFISTRNYLGFYDPTDTSNVCFSSIPPGWDLSIP